MVGFAADQATDAKRSLHLGARVDRSSTGIGLCRARPENHKVGGATDGEAAAPMLPAKGPGPMDGGHLQRLHGRAESRVGQRAALRKD